MKIRARGNDHLAQVLYTGKDFVIIDWAMNRTIARTD